MLHSEQFEQVAGALSQAQGQFPTIPRDRTVVVQLKNKTTGQNAGSYKFKYAPLETILAKTRKPLADAGLALVQSIVAEPTSSGGVVELLRSTLMHTSGQWLAVDVPIFHGTGDNKSQAYSSGMTYSRRYCASLILCVSADEDEDDDGNGGDQSEGRPDFERTEQRGNPRSAGGGQGQGPRSPQRRQQGGQRPPADDRFEQERDHDHGQPPADERELDQREQSEGRQVDKGTGELVTPYGDDLTAGQLQMLQARAGAAKLDDLGVLSLCGPISKANVSDALAKLKTAMQSAMQL